MVLHLVSVYIPTHNRSDMLKRALNSVLVQTYKNIEVIIVDDGSEDDTFSVVSEYKSKYSNIIYLKNKLPRGACHSRNRAINIAKGEFITGLDDDDEFDPLHIEILLKSYTDKYSFVAVSLKENDGESIFLRKDRVGIISLDLLLHYNVVGNQVFTKTQYLKLINGFDEKLPALQDYDTWLRLVKECGSGFKLAHATYILHTGHEKNRISNNIEERKYAFNRIKEKHTYFISKHHEQSRFILQKKIENTSISIIELIKNINLYNYKIAISLYINLNFHIIGSIWRKVKGEFTY